MWICCFGHLLPMMMILVYCNWFVFSDTPPHGLYILCVAFHHSLVHDYLLRVYSTCLPIPTDSCTWYLYFLQRLTVSWAVLVASRHVTFSQQKKKPSGPKLLWHKMTPLRSTLDHIGRHFHNFDINIYVC